MIKGKKIILGISGGIAAYKMTNVASMLYNVFIHRLQILVVRFPNSCYLHIFHAANLHKNFDIHAHPTK